MLRKIKNSGINWINGVALKKDEIDKILSNYNFHELDIEACHEVNQTARVDIYKDYIFIILHFPKYNQKLGKYLLNEFDIFVSKDYIITIQDYPSIHIDGIFNKYKDLKKINKKKISTGFILYEIIQVMLEKMFKICSNIQNDLIFMGDMVFKNPESSLVKDIMIKKRNIIVLKHMIAPEIEVIKRMEIPINTIFVGTLREYFDDLEDKITHVINKIEILKESMESIEDSFKTIIDIKTNNIIKLLTIFSALILPLTLITSFYGMNIKLPYDDNHKVIYLIILGIFFIQILIFLYFKMKKKF